jgi:hypothetical protein
MIGVDLGVSTVRAFQIVNEALKALVAEVRKLEVERLDHMLSVIWPTATNAMSEVTTVDAVSDAKASLLAKWNKMAERMRAAEVAAPMKDVTPLIEHEPIADAKTETKVCGRRRDGDQS